jgi:hypothetical protein
MLLRKEKSIAPYFLAHSLVTTPITLPALQSVAHKLSLTFFIASMLS